MALFPVRSNGCFHFPGWQPVAILENYSDIARSPVSLRQDGFLVTLRLLTRDLCLLDCTEHCKFN